VTNLSVHYGANGYADFAAYVETAEECLIVAYHVYAACDTETSCKPKGTLVRLYRIFPKVAQETTQQQWRAQSAEFHTLTPCMLNVIILDFNLNNNYKSKFIILLLCYLLVHY